MNYRVLIILMLAFIAINNASAQSGIYNCNRNVQNKHVRELRQQAKRSKEEIIQKARERQQRQQWMSNFKKQQAQRRAAENKAMERIQWVKEHIAIYKKTPVQHKTAQVPQFQVIDYDTRRQQRSWLDMPVKHVIGLEGDPWYNFMLMIRALKSPTMPGLTPPAEPSLVLNGY